jgi:hypothetical protein
LKEALNFIRLLQISAMKQLDAANNPHPRVRELLDNITRSLESGLGSKFADFLRDLHPHDLDLHVDSIIGNAFGLLAEVQGLVPQEMQEKKKRIVRQIMMGLCR